MADCIDALGTTAMDITDAQGAQLRDPGTVPQVNISENVSDCYKMNHNRRGMAIIINNKTFLPQTCMPVRNGTDVDAEAMYELLDTLCFEEIDQHNDQTVGMMKDKLTAASKVNHSNNDCFVCVILTHGEEGYVFGKDDKISIDELVRPFKGHNCTSLAGKPKLFFIQACRGSELDRGVTVADADGEQWEEVEVRRIPTEADFLIAYSVVPGYFSWRNSARGSWFIQAVVDVFKKNWKDMDLLTMMTRVNKKVALDFQSNSSKEHMHEMKQIPCVTSMLTKDVFFNKNM